MNNVFSAYNVNLLFCPGSSSVFWKMNVPERSRIPRLQSMHVQVNSPIRRAYGPGCLHFRQSIHLAAGKKGQVAPYLFDRPIPPLQGF